MALEYKNLMEDVVVQNAITMMKVRGCCTCDACTSDVVAYALNHVVCEAIDVVKESPRHDDR